MRILVVDDHAIVRKGLSLVISSEPDMEVVGEAVNGEEAVRLARALAPDIILMDLEMPKKNGIEAIVEIKKTSPAVKILVLTSFTDDDKVFPAIKGGASGYILKDTLPGELLEAIRGIDQGRVSLHPMIAEKLMREIAHPEQPPARGERLTGRELEILKMIAQGNTNHQIAEKLVVSERTISTHVGNILNKLHLANRTLAALYAVKEGLADSSAEK